MNTEQRVLAMLSKVKQIKADKKEKLGAIEDAVNEVKSELIDLRDNIVGLTRDLEMAISQYDEANAKATSDLSDAIREADQQFSMLQEEAFVKTTELDNLGISYDIDIDGTIDNYMQFFDIADSKI
jgi:chromosome segregation ATPase